MATQKMSREARNQYRKANNAQIKAKRKAEAEKRDAEWRALSKSDQIRQLLDRPGYCEKQLKRLGFIVN